MKVLLFDIDGTLLISRGIGREAKRRAMLECFGLTGDLDKHVFGGKTDWGILADLLAPPRLQQVRYRARNEQVRSGHGAAHARNQRWLFRPAPRPCYGIA